MLLLFLLGGIAHAAGLPDYYPVRFEKVGVIDDVNIGAGKIIINDKLYQLGKDTPINSLSRKGDSIARLKRGANVGITFTRYGRVRAVTEVWLLPSYYKQR